MARKWFLVVACLALVFAIAVPTTFSQFEFPQPGGATSGEEINFGNVLVGQTQTAQYTFTVLATSQTSAQVTIYAPCSPFGFSGLASQSMVLQPGQSITFGVTFTPPQAQAYTCSFVIRAAGGYPVQEMETVVQLSGQGGSGTAAPSEEPGSASPGFPIGFPFTEAPLPQTAQGVSGTTDNEGKFDVTVMPASNVTGKLMECDGPALSNREFRITPLDDGYEIAVSEFKPVVAQPAAKISLFGMESIDLGEVCVEPVIEEVIELPTSLGTDESETCPCCSIIIEAQMCCNPRNQYVETSTIYEPQLVRIRVAYCEPPEDLGDVDLTPLPLTNTGGILVNPGLIPSPSGLDPGQVGVTSITLNGESLFEGDGEFEKTVHVGTLQPGMHTVGATIGRFDGEECVCEKTFEVLPCPDVDARLEWTLEPEDGYSPVRVTYDLDWPDGNEEICDLWYWDNKDLPGSMQQVVGFPTSATYSATDGRMPRYVEPEVRVTANSCCQYDIRGEPFVVKPPVRCECGSLPSADDCKKRTIRYQIAIPEGCRPATMSLIDATSAAALWDKTIWSQDWFDSLSPENQRHRIQNESIIGVESGQVYEYTGRGAASNTHITIQRRDDDPNQWVLELTSCCHTIPTIRTSVSCPDSEYSLSIYSGLYFDDDNQYVVYSDVHVDGQHLTRENFNSFFEDCSVPYCDVNDRSDPDSLGSNGRIWLQMRPDLSCNLDLAAFREDLCEALSGEGCYCRIPDLDTRDGSLKGNIYSNRCTPQIVACIKDVLERHTDCKEIQWIGRQINIVPKT